MQIEFEEQNNIELNYTHIVPAVEQAWLCKGLM